MLDEQLRTAAKMMSSFEPPATVAGAADIYGNVGLVAKGSWMCDTAGVTEPWQYRGGLLSAFQDTLAKHDRLISTFGPSATVAGGADIYGNVGLVAKGGRMPDTAGLTEPWQYRGGLLSAFQDTLAKHDRLISTFGPSATVAGGADIYGNVGLVAKGGRMPDTAGLTEPWQYRGGVASAVQDSLAEHQRMQDQMMKSLGPLATAGPADMYATAGSSVTKGIMVGESFGFAKSLDAQRRLTDSSGLQGMFAAQNLPKGWAAIDEAIAAQKRIERPWTHYGAAAMAAGAGMHKTPGMTATIAGYGSAAGGVDQLGGFASGLVGTGLLAKLDGAIAGMQKGSTDLSSLMTATRGIADFASSLTDVGGIARVNDEISRVERSFAIPSAVTDIARTLAGSAQMTRTVRGVDPFTGLAVPMGIGDYLRAPGVADTLSKVWPATDLSDDITADKRVIVPDPLKDSLLRLPTISERRFGLAAIWALRELVAYVDLEAGVTPPGHVMQLVSLLWAVAFAWSEFLERKSSGC